jgi:hypothetical protein
VSSHKPEVIFVPGQTLLYLAGVFNPDYTSPGDGLSLTMSNATLRNILNEIVKTSEAKYWIVNRDGQDGEYLILKLLSLNIS